MEEVITMWGIGALTVFAIVALLAIGRGMVILAVDEMTEGYEPVSVATELLGITGWVIVVFVLLPLVVGDIVQALMAL